MRSLIAIIGLMIVGGHLMAVTAFAQDSAVSPSYALMSELFADRLTFSSGMDQSENAQTTYGSADIALTAKLNAQGWRLKLFGSHSQFQYSATQVYCALSAEEKKSSTGTNFTELCNDIANQTLDHDTRENIEADIAPFGLELNGDQVYFRKAYQGQRYELAVMPGYQFILGQLVVKGFAGVAYQHQAVFPADPRNSINGDFWGTKGAVEIWARLSDKAWVSADGAYFTPTASYSGSIQLGYELLSWLTIGPQFAAFGDMNSDSGRSGGFLRFDLMGTETTISAGLASDYGDNRSIYGAANMFVRF